MWRSDDLWLMQGDCREVMPLLAQHKGKAIHAIVTDPPYGLSFMGKAWDHAVPGPEYWRACMDLLPPGGHVLAFGGTRTYHRLMCAIEDAGFEIRDTLMWLYGQGFPKSHNASKAMGDHGLAEAWAGYGTALKPGWEPIVMARKPLVGTVTQNMFAHGTGALNIDACRVPTPGRPHILTNIGQPDTAGHTGFGAGLSPGSRAIGTTDQGRWPANVVHDGSPQVEEAFAAFGVSKSTQALMFNPARPATPAKGAEAERNSVRGHTDQGTASRFYYCAKASKAERQGSKHPTVKPEALMRWCVRMVTPAGGTVLDPFAGSGTTGAAALAEGLNAVLIEREPEHIAHMRKRFSL